MTETARAAGKGPVIVAGAGIVGISTAIWLQREGREVILIDRAGPGEGASHGNAGVLASCSILPVVVPGVMGKVPRMLLDPRQPLFLRWSYLPRLLPWLLRYVRHASPSEVSRIADALFALIGDSLAEHRALASGTKAEGRVVATDYCYVYRDRAQFLADGFVWDTRARYGFVWHELEGQAFRSYDPVFGGELGFCARMPGYGLIDSPGDYVRELADHAIAGGARFIRAEVTDFVRENGRIAGVRAGGETFACGDVVVATGAWSRLLCGRLGLDVPLETERGYHIELWEPSVMPRAPMMMAGAKVVATPMTGRLRLAGVVELGGLTAPPARRPLELLLESARRAIPGLAWKEKSEWMGHRPAPADSIPLIGGIPGVRGAWLGLGHHHIGLTGGPKTGKLLARMICGRNPDIDPAPYAPARFS